MEWNEVWPVRDLSPAAWLVRALDVEQSDIVGGVVPGSFPAHIEITLDEENDTLSTVRDALSRHTASSARCWFAIDMAWPVPDAWRDCRTFPAHQDQLALFDGSFSDLASIVEAFDATPPSLWWPADRSWVLGRHIDSDCMHMACPPDVAADVLAVSGLDARAVGPNDAFHVDEY